MRARNAFTLSGVSAPSSTKPSEQEIARKGWRAQVGKPDLEFSCGVGIGHALKDHVGTVGDVPQLPRCQARLKRPTTKIR